MTWTQQGKVTILDPFGGSHSTGVAAIMAGCGYIGFDNDVASKVRN
jgi:DNA modification methylase